MISEFYMNLQMIEFMQDGMIQFSNPECLPEYKAELERRNLDYKVVRGLGDYGINIVICKPEKEHKYIEQLDYETKRLEEILALKKSYRILLNT